ncbi:MAG: PKD domain-containing protein, partial [Sphingobacteriales bacterium]
YTITLKTFTFNTPGSVCSDSIQRTIQLGPAGRFEHTTGFLCNNRAASFQVHTSNTASFIFDFGDGTQQTTTSNTITHVYANPGTYTPKVTLINSAGCELVLPGNDPIQVDRIKAGFQAVQQQLCGSTDVRFTDTSFAFFGTSSSRWDFGDGTSATGKQVAHTYNTPGAYIVSLIITGNSGCSDTLRQTLNVVVNDIPVAAIQAESISCTGYNILFKSVVQSTNAINITKWSTSNGVTNNNPLFENIFTLPGDYSVRFIAGTVNGCYDTVVHNIRVNASPTVRASNDVNICLGSNTRLSAVSTSPLNWSPTTGLSCTTCADPIATPLISTPYVVQATNAAGCFGYDTVVVTVIQPLQMNVSADDSICIGQSSQL